MPRSVLSSVNAITHVPSSAFSPFFLLLKHTRQPLAPLTHLSAIHPATFIKFRLIKVDGGGYLRQVGSRSQIKLADPSSLSFEHSPRAGEFSGGDSSEAREAFTKIGRVFREPLGSDRVTATRSRCIYFSPGCQAHARAPSTSFRFSEIHLPPARRTRGPRMHNASGGRALRSASDIHFTAVVLWKKKKETIFTRVSLLITNVRGRAFKLHR